MTSPVFWVTASLCQSVQPKTGRTFTRRNTRDRQNDTGTSSNSFPSQLACTVWWHIVCRVRTSFPGSFYSRDPGVCVQKASPVNAGGAFFPFPQKENSEWSLDYRSRLLAAAFIWYNKNTASDDIQWLPGWRPRSLKQMYLSVNRAKIKGISANMHYFELYRLLGEQCYFL